MKHASHVRDELAREVKEKRSPDGIELDLEVKALGSSAEYKRWLADNKAAIGAPDGWKTSPAIWKTNGKVTGKKIHWVGGFQEVARE